jgi:hypothetical protein
MLRAGGRPTRFGLTCASTGRAGAAGPVARRRRRSRVQARCPTHRGISRRSSRPSVCAASARRAPPAAGDMSVSWPPTLRTQPGRGSAGRWMPRRPPLRRPRRRCLARLRQTWRGFLYRRKERRPDEASSARWLPFSSAWCCDSAPCSRLPARHAPNGQPGDREADQHKTDGGVQHVGKRNEVRAAGGPFR